VFIDLLLIFIIKAVQRFLRALPEKRQQGVGILLGRTGFRLLKGRRKIALSNIRRVFKDLSQEEITHIARRCFENLGVNLVESLLLPFVPKEEYGKRFKLENFGPMESALQLNKGAIALVFHYANWEIMGIASWFVKNPIVVLARPLKRHKMLNDFLNGMRASTGLTVIANENTSRDVMRHLKENRIIAILGDQREKRSRGVYVDFFGEPVPTTRGIATIAMKTGTPVVPFYFVRDSFLRYTIRCGEPLVMERKGNIEELIASNTRKINAFLEAIILENPTEWFWVHRRWGREKH
jgi:Kdo2-lipid IVA lauroyltransferase/acyltransferase